MRGYFYAFLVGVSLVLHSAVTHAQLEAESRLIDVVPKSSLPQVSAGSDFGISVDIKNKSKSTVYFQGKWITLTLPPELNAQSPSSGWWGNFSLPGLTKKEEEQQVDWWEKIVPLAPGDSTAVFWARTSRRVGQEADPGIEPGKDSSKAWRFISEAWRYINEKTKQMTFVPGDYTLKVVVVYWTDEKDAGQVLRDSRSAIFDVKIPVVAPQWVIIFGAIIGGLISYILLPKVRLNPARIDIWGLLTSGLLSVIVTILLARISETQFLVRITVNDIWGAIAVGFIAGASGTTILKRWIPAAESPDTKKPSKEIDQAQGAKGQQSADPATAVQDTSTQRNK